MLVVWRYFNFDQEKAHKAAVDAAIGAELWNKIQSAVATPDEVELGNFLAFRTGTAAEDSKQNGDTSDDSQEEATPSVTCSNSARPSQDAEEAGSGNYGNTDVSVEVEEDVLVGDAADDEAESDADAKRERAPSPAPRRRAICSDPNCEFADYEATVPTATLEDTSVWSDETKLHIKLCHTDC